MKKQAVVSVGIALTLLSSLAMAQKKATDVRPNHWATQAVQQALDNRVMDLTDGTNFRGEAKVTRTQAVIALGKLARSLETRQWRAKKSVALPVPPTEIQVVDTSQPVTRYTLSVVLTRFGNYLMNGLKGPGKTDLAKSTVLPPLARVTVPTSHPAHASLAYLASKRMIWPGSPLLKPDDKPVQSTELSRALAEMATGLTNLWTELGLDENGETPDRTFRQKPPAVKP